MRVGVLLLCALRLGKRSVIAKRENVIAFSFDLRSVCGSLYNRSIKSYSKHGAAIGPGRQCRHKHLFLMIGLIQKGARTEQGRRHESERSNYLVLGRGGRQSPQLLRAVEPLEKSLLPAVALLNVCICFPFSFVGRFLREWHYLGMTTCPIVCMNKSRSILTDSLRVVSVPTSFRRWVPRMRAGLILTLGDGVQCLL